MDKVSGGSNGDVPHGPPDHYYYYFTILEYLVICCWPCSIDTFDFIFGCFFGYFCCFSPKYFVKLAFKCFSSILYWGTKCKMSYALVWWKLLLCEVRCFVMISALRKALTAHVQNYDDFFLHELVIANQLLTRQSPFAPLCKVEDWLAKPSLEDEFD